MQFPQTSSPTSTVVVSSPNVTSSSSQPAQTLNPSTLEDIATMTERRLTFIVAGAGSASNISEWYVKPLSTVFSSVLNPKY